MNRKTRYSLLALGFLFFLVAAPLIVLYVRGISFDFKTSTFVKTGILAVNSDPSSAAVYLDGELKRQNSGDVKFIPAGEYQVEIKKDGYWPWSKRLTVQAGQVTWASDAYNKIYLFLKDAQAKTLDNDVLDFYADGNRVYVLKKDAFGPLNNLTGSKYALPSVANTILAHDDSGKIFLLAGNSAATSSAPTLLLFNSDSEKFIDLTGLFSTLPQVEFNGQDLYALDGTTLYKINTSSRTKTPLLQNIGPFYFQGDNLYYTQANATSTSLLLAPAPFTAPQEILSGLPDLQNSQLLVTPQKHIFILQQGNLYSASASMQKLAENVSNWSFDVPSSVLSVLHAGELDYAGPLDSSLNFVTRSGSQIADPYVKTDIGYAFFINQGNINAIELDGRSGQNQYVLYSGAVQKFYIDDSAKNIYLLDSGQLKSLGIR